MSKKVKVEIISPNRVFYTGEVNALTIRTTEGDICIMYDHQPLVMPLSSGPLKLKLDKEVKLAAVFGGFCQVSLDGDVSIVCENAEWLDEIDKDRAIKAKQRAEERLNQKKSDTDFDRARLALNRAITRINVSNHGLGGK